MTAIFDFVKRFYDNYGSEVASTIFLQSVSMFFFFFVAVGNIILFFSNRKVSRKNNEIQRILGQMQKEDNQKVRVNTYISDKRIEWIQTFRILVSEYIDKTSLFMSAEPDDFIYHIDGLLSLSSKIRLHLNFSGMADSYVLSNIYAINRLIELVIIMKPDNLNNVEKIGLNEDDHKSLQRIDLYYKMMQQSLNSNDYTTEEIRNISAKEWRKILDDVGLVRANYYGVLLGHIWRLKDVISLRRELVVIYTELYLKIEWERVKYEVVNGESTQYPMSDRYMSLMSNRQRDIEWINEAIKQIPNE